MEDSEERLIMSIEPEDDHEGVSLGYCRVKSETELAILVMNEQLEDRWIPKSVIHDDSEVWNGRDGNEGDLIVKAWWAEKEGLDT